MRIRETKEERRKRVVTQRKEIKRMLACMRSVMKAVDEEIDVGTLNGFQDFFGMMDIEMDEEAREWLKDPKNLLLLELYVAELLARQGGKRKTMDTHGFEINLFENLMKLRDALWSGYYYPNRGTVHVIFDPVQREIFAAPYVDRILHHWVVGIVMKWQDRRLIQDSYSCRRGKGTLYGVERLQHHILSVSRNFKEEAYVIQLDIRGYFMHIRRDVLYDLVKERVNKEFPKWARGKRYDILMWAAKQVIFDDPTDGVRLQGSYRDWLGLPEDKSLMMQPEGRGMVIGNYTSQTFSNIYLDPLDRFVRFTLGYKHYGRYVDDFYIVVRPDELEQAKRNIKAIANFLAAYGLEINTKKTKVTEVHKGVKFLGVVVRGFRMFPGPRLVKNFREAVVMVATGRKDPDTIASYLGMFSHLDAGKIIKSAFNSVGWDYVYDTKRRR